MPLLLGVPDGVAPGLSVAVGVAVTEAGRLAVIEGVAAGVPLPDCVGVGVLVALPVPVTLDVPNADAVDERLAVVEGVGVPLGDAPGESDAVGDAD